MKARETTWESTLNGLKDRGVFPGAIHRVLLYGPPGTGKSAWAHYAFDGQVERVTLHRQQYYDDLIGSYALMNGTTEWKDGPAVRAFRNGRPLVLDEFDQFSPECRCALHAVMDDLSVAGILLPTGETVRPKEGFCVIATSNAHPSELPDALADRFDLVLCADRPADGLLGRLSVGAQTVIRNHYERSNVQRWTAPLSARAMLALAKLEGAGVKGAAALIFGEGAADIVNAMAVSE
jgi:MoxR-like ATPase